jgi:hypothetical protein
LTLSNTSSFVTWSVQLIFSILLQHHFQNFPDVYDLLPEASKLQHHYWTKITTSFVFLRKPLSLTGIEIRFECEVLFVSYLEFWPDNGFVKSSWYTERFEQHKMLSENIILIACPSFDLFILVYTYFIAFYAYCYNLFYLQDGRLCTCWVSCWLKSWKIYINVYIYLFIYSTHGIIWRKVSL